MANVDVEVPTEAQYLNDLAAPAWDIQSHEQADIAYLARQVLELRAEIARLSAIVDGGI
jgi:hypothetical protein